MSTNKKFTLLNLQGDRYLHRSHQQHSQRLGDFNHGNKFGCYKAIFGV